jgi:hypothetical protein
MDVLMDLLTNNWGYLVVVLVGWVGKNAVKLGRAKKVITTALNASADGKLTKDEKAAVFDEVWAYLSGFWPDKSKVK